MDHRVGIVYLHWRFIWLNGFSNFIYRNYRIFHLDGDIYIFTKVKLEIFSRDFED